MTLRKRIRLPSASYETSTAFSITIATLSRAAVFADLSFSLRCVEILADVRRRTGSPVYAYCLMPDHVHLLVGSSSMTTLTRFVGAWKSECYRERRSRGRDEKFWQRSFYDHALRSSEDLRVVAKYILNNPIRAGLAAEFREYPLCGSMEFEL